MTSGIPRYRCWEAPRSAMEWGCVTLSTRSDTIGGKTVGYSCPPLSRKLRFLISPEHLTDDVLHMYCGQVVYTQPTSECRWNCWHGPHKSFRRPHQSPCVPFSVLVQTRQCWKPGTVSSESAPDANKSTLSDIGELTVGTQFSDKRSSLQASRRHWERYRATGVFMRANSISSEHLP